jgi:hypothetical protein
MSKNEHRVRSFQSFRKDEIVESNPGWKIGRLRKTKARLSNTPQTNWCQEPISLWLSSSLFYSLSLSIYLSYSLYRSPSDTPPSLSLSSIKKDPGQTSGTVPLLLAAPPSLSLPISARFFLIL